MADWSSVDLSNIPTFETPGSFSASDPSPGFLTQAGEAASKFNTGAIGDAVKGVSIFSTLKEDRPAWQKAIKVGAQFIPGASTAANVGDFLTKELKSFAPENKVWNRFVQYGPLGAIYSSIFE